MSAASAVGRRRILQVAAAVGVTLLTGCNPLAASPNRRPHSLASGPVPPGPDVRLVIGAVAAEELLLDFCEELVRHHRGLGSTVTPLARRQRQQVEALRAALSTPPKGLVAGHPTTRPTLPRPSPRRVPAVSRHRADALARLRLLTTAAERDRAADCRRAVSGPLASLFASLAASHAVTVELLRAPR